jgi:AcrR family transcriptional regulator
MRRLAAELGVTQPVIYSAFASRQALIDAAALAGFTDLGADLHAAERYPRARMGAYLAFAAAHPRTYEAMFSLPSGLVFAADDTPQPLQDAFTAIQDAFPDADGTQAEVAWALLHGLATLGAGGRLRPNEAQSRLDLAHAVLTGQPSGPTQFDHERAPS